MKVCFLILPIMVIILVVIFSGQAGITYGQANDASQINTYENMTEGIRYQYPSYWGNLTNEMGCINNPCFIPIESDKEIINKTSFGIIRMFDKASRLSPTCACDTLIEFVRFAYPVFQERFQDFTFINDNQTSVGKNNNSAWQIEYKGTLHGLSHQDNSSKLVVFTKADNRFYTISFGPFSKQLEVKHLPEFKRLIASMEFSPTQISTPRIPSFMNMSDTLDSNPNMMIQKDFNELQILSHNSFTDSLDYLHVVGEVKNNSPSSKTFVKITGTFYDANNQVVGTDFAYTNPSDIGAGQKAPFELILTSASVPVSLVDHYNLIASSQ